MVFPEEPTCRCGIYYEEQITHRAKHIGRALVILKQRGNINE